ncbi:colicin-like pore-forming protein [Erwinia papayae]|uniref:Colicin-like pore-forming protein n=1 Tax=Erwinia papayae TaxID=206499 RepID=A0ABV3N5N7_9GAMM
MSNFGDGTGWSSERGDSSGYSGSTGNSGNRESNSGNDSNTNGYMAELSRLVAQETSKSKGIPLNSFSVYVYSTDGEVIGIPDQNPKPGDSYGVNLGYPPPSTSNGSSGNSEAPGGSVSYNLDLSDANIASLKNTIAVNEPMANSSQSGTRITAARNAVRRSKAEIAVIEDTRKKLPPDSEIQEAIKFTTDFYSVLTDKFSERFANHARNFANKAKGKRLRNATDAYNAFLKNYKDKNVMKFSKSDRMAMLNALNSVEYSSMARNLKRFSVAMGYYGTIADIVDVVGEIRTALQTNQWRSVFVKLETIAAGKVAVVATGFAFSLIIGTPIGIIGYAVIMAVVGAMINDNLINEINSSLGLK